MAVMDEKVEGAPKQAKRFNPRIALLIVAVLALAGIGYYIYSSGYEETDDAFIEGDVVGISPRVSAVVTQVRISDNQMVKAGDVLVELDPADFQAKADEARAKVAVTQAQLQAAQQTTAYTNETTKATIRQATSAQEAADAGVAQAQEQKAQAEANVRRAQADLDQAKARVVAAEAEASRTKSDAARYQALYAKDEVSKQVLDNAVTQAQSAAANLDAARQAVSSAEASLHQMQATVRGASAAIKQAQAGTFQAVARVSEARAGNTQVLVRTAEAKTLEAQLIQQQAELRQAELNLSYTTIRAPIAGRITRKNVQIGALAQVGSPLFSIVPSQLYVIANFKETQVRHMHPGQEVEVKVDAFPDRKLRGKIDSIQSGTGARFSLLPPENATGNYVKVVQRVPVKIVFAEPDEVMRRLGPGMSVVPEVKIK